MAALHQLRQDQLRLIDRHGKADAAGLAADRRVDADDLAAAVDQRAAAVAEIDRGVGLDVVVEARVEQLAADEADDTDRHGVFVGERIADRAHPLADAQVVGIAQRRVRKLASASTLISAMSVSGSDPMTSRAQAAAVGELDGDALGVLDDVVVGEDVPASSMMKPVPAPRRGVSPRRR